MKKQEKKQKNQEDEGKGGREDDMKGRAGLDRDDEGGGRRRNVFGISFCFSDLLSFSPSLTPSYFLLSFSFVFGVKIFY